MLLARVKVFSVSSFATGNWISRADKSPDARVGAMVSAERLTLASVYLVTAAVPSPCYPVPCPTSCGYVTIYGFKAMVGVWGYYTPCHVP